MNWPYKDKIKRTPSHGLWPWYLSNDFWEGFFEDITGRSTGNQFFMIEIFPLGGLDCLQFFNAYPLFFGKADSSPGRLSITIKAYFFWRACHFLNQVFLPLGKCLSYQDQSAWSAISVNSASYLYAIFFETGIHQLFH